MSIWRRLLKPLCNEHGFVATTAALVSIGTAVGVGGAGLAAGLTGAAIVGAAAYGATTLLTGGMGGPQQQQASFQPSAAQQQAIQAPVPTAQETVQKAEAEATAERKKVLARRSKTVLTGPAGVFGEADTAKKTLLGA